MGGSHQPYNRKKNRKGQPSLVFKALVCRLNIPLRSKLLVALHHLRVTGSGPLRGIRPWLWAMGTNDVPGDRCLQLEGSRVAFDELVSEVVDLGELGAFLLEVDLEDGVLLRVVEVLLPSLVLLGDDVAAVGFGVPMVRH